MMKWEKSKQIVTIVQIVFFISMAASYVLPIFFVSVKDVALGIFQATATLTGSVLIGYYGKAGFENYDKNKKIIWPESRHERGKGNE